MKQPANLQEFEVSLADVLPTFYISTQVSVKKKVKLRGAKELAQLSVMKAAAHPTALLSFTGQNPPKT